MSNKIYVGNLSFNIIEAGLSELFEKFGTVSSCKIIMDRDSGRSKGFGFIEMSSANEASEAISNLDGNEFDGRNLKVNEAKPQERRERSFENNRW
ncbi:MAG: RNA-binding protein [Bacteriovoracaceae bacterium]|nr:RNA-binding protein [Bacteriovoracaceae bacterium]